MVRRDGAGRPRRMSKALNDVRVNSAIEMKAKGASLQDIADELGWNSKSAVAHAIRRALEERAKELPMTVDAYREQQMGQLDMMERAVWKVLETHHVVVSHGQVITMLGADGQPTVLEDDKPVLAAVDRLLKIQERRARLTGTDQPVKTDIGLTVRYEINGVTPGDLT